MWDFYTYMYTRSTAGFKNYPFFKTECHLKMIISLSSELKSKCRQHEIRYVSYQLIPLVTQGFIIKYSAS